MALVQILYEGTDITNKVISYDRDKSICTGIGALRLSLLLDPGFTPVLYKKIVVYEGGYNKGTYYIHTIDRDLPQSTLTLNAQNGSIKLQDYFIAESYLVDYPSTSDYWIRKFLDAAKVSYVFDSGETGTLISNNTSLGMCTAMDAIQPLLQQNGWYISFDANDTAHIGKLSIDTSSYKETLYDTKILSLDVVDHDRMFRNRAVVWGNGDPAHGRWIYADVDQHGKYPNEYPGGNDVRSMVIANGNIKDKWGALNIANRAIKEFSKTNKEITLDVAGSVGVDPGDYVFVKSKYHHGAGLVTTEGSSLSSSGFITHLILNQRCPRLFAYYDWGGYVYVGTQGAGVWRKPLDGPHTWENFSTGLTDLNITDLAIDAGVFACVSQGGKLFVRTDVDATWVNFSPTLTDTLTVSGITTTFPASSGMATTCTIDKTTGDIIAGFSLRVVASSDPSRSWLYYIHDSANYTGYQLSNENGLTDYTITSLDNNGTDNLVSVHMQSSGLDYLWNDNRHGGSYSYGNTNLIQPSGVAASGWCAFNMEDGTTPIGYLFEMDTTTGDGKYVYQADGTYYYSVAGPLTGSRISFYETDTTSNAYKRSYQFFNDHPGGKIRTEFLQAIGNRTVAWTEVWRQYIDETGYGYGNYYTTIHAWSVLEGEKTLDLNTVIPPNYIPLCTLGIANGSAGRYYILFGVYNENLNLKLAYYDYQDNKLVTVANNAIPAGLEGGVGYGCYETRYQGLVSDETLIFPFGGVYMDVPIGGELKDCNAPMVVFYHQGNGMMYVNSSALSVINGEAGEEAMYEWGDDRVDGTLGGRLYWAMYLSGTDYWADSILEFMEPYGCRVVASTTTDFFEGSVGNRNHLYFVADDGNITHKKLVNVIGGGSWILPIENERSAVVGQLDETDDSAYVYDLIVGSVRKFPPSGTSVYYDFDAPANLDDIEYFGDIIPIDTIENYANLVNDIFVLRTFAWGWIVGGAMNYLGRTTSYVVYPSGERLLPHDYSVLPGNGDFILQGYKSNPYVTVLDTDTPFQIDSSGNFPWAVWGGKSYSGMVISGIQTGWNQGQAFVSPDGGEGTYTALILNGLHSYVPDMRSLNMSSGYGDYLTMDRYVLVPQPTSTIIEEGNTELVLVDVSSITNAGGIIITSGTLNQYATVLETFEGFANHVETTNTQDVPYMFVSISGVPPKFYQRDGYTSDSIIVPSGFIDRTNNLPNNAINTIRCDDLI